MFLNEIFGNFVEGARDTHTFKALFVLGGPGSGKTTLAKMIANSYGLRRVDVDSFYEMIKVRELRKQGQLKPGEPAQEIPVPDEMTQDPVWTRSKQARISQRETYLSGRLGLVLDETGRYYPSIEHQVKDLQRLGYDVAILLVDVDIETAQARVQRRPRKINPSIVEQFHQEVRENIPRYQQLLGSNFLIINNSAESMSTGDVLTVGAYRWLGRWLRRPVDNPEANVWRQSQLGETTESLEGITEAKALAPGAKKILFSDSPEYLDLIDLIKHTESQIQHTEKKLKQLSRSKTADQKKSMQKVQKQISQYQTELQDARDSLNSKSIRKEQTQLQNLVDTIKQDCSKYTEVFNTTKKVMYRGASDQGAVYRGRSWNKREPLDSESKMQDLYDLSAKQLGFTAVRGNSIFVTSSMRIAQDYYKGAIYVIYPLNTAAFTWSKNKVDVVLGPDYYKALMSDEDDKYGNLILKERIRTKKLILASNTIAHKQKKKNTAADPNLKILIKNLEKYLDILRDLDEDPALVRKRYPTYDEVARQISKYAPDSMLLNDPVFKAVWQNSKQDNLAEFQKTFQLDNQDLEGALNSGHEIMISGEYFAIEHSLWEKLRSHNLL